MVGFDTCRITRFFGHFTDRKLVMMASSYVLKLIKRPILLRAITLCLGLFEEYDTDVNNRSF